tara:strand:- start:101 stop:247 length:147 start_codon:yes stop_codon:yes gene_type:complete
MSLFERGLNLSQTNQNKLKEAEHKVEILMTKNGQHSLEEFIADEKYNL